MLLLARINIERDGFLLHNVLSCFTSPRASVYTSAGYREISTLAVGDLVLTHKGRFRKITATHFHSKQVLPHYIVKLSDGTQHGVTGGHGWILCDGQVVLTEHLETGMQVPGLCEPCHFCGKQFHRKFKKSSAAYCSKRCFNTAIARRSKDKISQSMLEQYKTGVRDPFAITKAANETVRKLASLGVWDTSVFISKGGKEAHRIKSAIARQGLSLKGSQWVGHGEQELFDLLTAAGYSPIPQFALDGYNYDFKVGDTLLEVDNPVRDCQTAVKIRKQEKEEVAKEHGLNIISIPSDNIGVALNLLKNDEHDYEFVPVTVLSVERSRDRAGLWSCEVEEDESYVVKGIAHHNCRPPNNKFDMPYIPIAIQHCAPNLDRSIETIKRVAKENGKTPIIVTLGVHAFKRVLGLDHKKDSELLKKDYWGYPFWADKYGVWVIAAPHPAYLVRGNTHLWPVLQFTVTRALEVANNGFHFDRTDYTLDPQPAAFERWAQGYIDSLNHDPDNPLSYDIETPYKKKTGDEEDLGKEEDADHTILRISFCYLDQLGSYQTVSVKWSAEYLATIERLFNLANYTLGWNSNKYDAPRVSRHVKMRGIDLDAMVAWHILNSSLPKALGFVTPYYYQNCSMWKHLADSEPAFYNAKDSHAALINWFGIKKDLIANNLWHVYERHWIELYKALKYMSGIGVLRDNEMRDKAEKDMSLLLDQIETKMEEAVPVEARKLKIYKKTPKEIAIIESEYKKAEGTALGKEIRDAAIKSTGLLELEKEYPVAYCVACGLQKPKRWKKHSTLCGGTETELPEVQKVWGKPLGFKVSKLGMTNYQNFLKHEAIVDRKAGKTTFNADAITLLIRKYPSDPLYPSILEHRKIQKLLGTYVGITLSDGRLHGGMPVGRDGRIHTQYGRDASTLRFTSEDPNLQNLPRPNQKDPDDPTNIIRNLIVAGAGNILYARDFSGIEAVLTGYFAADPKYIRLAKRDIHTYYTVYALYELEGGARIKAADLPNLDWPDDRLFPHLESLKKEFKQERNNLYKHLVHAANFMQGAKGAQAKIFSETGIDYPVSTVKKVMDVYYALFPKIKQWHKAVLDEAEKDGYLRNPYDYIHRFNRPYDYKWEHGSYTKKPGPDANKCIAFKPQSTAVGIITEAMLRLFYDKFEEAGQYLRLQVHDELFFEVPEEKLDYLDKIVKEEMERPIPQMRMPASWGMGEFINILTEEKKGLRWGSMK